MNFSRRDFLTAASVTAVVAGSPHLLKAAPAPLVAASTSTSASTSKFRPTVIGTSLERGMFKNLARSLISVQSAAGYAYPAILDVNGYPTSSPQSTIAGSIKMPGNLALSSQLVLKWSGTASIQLARGAPGFTVVSGSNFVSGSTDYNLNVVGTNARVVFTFRGSMPTGVTLNFLAGGKFSGLSNLVLCRLSDEAAIDRATTPEEMFDDDYVSIYKTLNPGIFRPMGWVNPNFGNVSQARYIAPWQSALNLIDQRWVPSAWAGATSGTNTYVCAAPKDASNVYVDGELIQLQFASSNTSNAVTVNSGGRGAVPVLTSSGQAPSSGSISAGSLASLTYDAVLGAFLWQKSGQTACLPYELQIAFANRINADFWCVFPTYIDDASVTTITQLVRTKLNSGLNAYFEYGNEIWNWSFPATAWAEAKGLALGFPADNGRRSYGWMALRYRQVMGLVTTAWSPRTPTQLKRVFAFQAFGPAGATSNYKLAGSDLNGAVYPKYAARKYQSYNAAPNRPIDYCDVLSYATYYSGAQCTNFDGNYVGNGAANISGLLAAADDYASGVPSKMTSALAFLDNDIRAGKLTNGKLGGQTLLALNSGANGQGIYPIWESVAKTWNKPVVCYEGGFESWYPSVATCTKIGIATSYGDANGKIALLIDAYKRSDMFAAVVRDQMTQFLAQPHSKAAAWLLISGLNQWSLSSGDSYAPKFKSWDSVRALSM